MPPLLQHALQFHTKLIYVEPAELQLKITQVAAPRDENIEPKATAMRRNAKQYDGRKL